MRFFGGLLVACLVMLLPAVALADINVEARRPSKDDDGFDFRLETRIGFKQGNINFLDLGGEARLAYQRGRHFAFYFHDSTVTGRSLARAGGTVNDVLSRDARYVNRHLGHLRYSVRATQRVAPEIFGQLETNEFTLVRARWLFGLGLRFTLWENEQFGMYAGPAYLAEREDLDNRFFISQPTADGPDNWFQRLGSVLTMSFRATDRISLHTTTYFQPRFDVPTDFIVLNDNALAVKLVNHLELKLSATIRHDHAPSLYCAAPLAAGACAPELTRRLVANDVALTNAFAAYF